MTEIDTIVRTITVYAIPVLFAISLHEAAHGYVAKYFGDPTASDAGRLSLNPARHIDPFGTIVLPLLLYLSIHVPFGYAKPVPVDFNRLRNPHKQMPWVAFAGPAANLAMALGWMVLLVLVASASQGGAGDLGRFLMTMARAGVSVNCAMFVFNLIPIPPLDGGRILTGLLPLPLARKFARIELYGPYVFLALIAATYLHLLDGILLASIGWVTMALAYLVFPLTLLLN
jgi:Zn-dependent protease